jgi:hypothetical protein
MYSGRFGRDGLALGRAWSCRGLGLYRPHAALHESPREAPRGQIGSTSAGRRGKTCGKYLFRRENHAIIACSVVSTSISFFVSKPFAGFVEDL